MPRSARSAPGGLVYHVLNRSAGRFKMFRGERDFDAFVRVMLEAHRRFPLRICYCILSNHWHFVPWPEKDGQLTEFFRWLTLTHAMRWRSSHHTLGWGHLYQGRFKSFPVENDESFLTVCRYVERNALTAGLVERAEDWRWGSLWARLEGGEELREMLSPWPVERPRRWVELVNTPLNAKEVERVRMSIERGRPFGSESWVARVSKQLGLDQTLRGRGRPAKAAGAGANRGDQK